MRFLAVIATVTSQQKLRGTDCPATPNTMEGAHLGTGVVLELKSSLTAGH